MTVLGTAAALALLAALVIRAPWATTPVLRPGGLTVSSRTVDSVTIRWLWPASGTAPDRYLILGNGKVIGSVPGTRTSYRQTGLAPGTAYRYRVTAMRGGARSVPSPSVVVTTAIPPVPAARWQGTWPVGIKIAHGAALLAGQGPLQVTGSWQARPRCAAGACAVRLIGDLSGRTFAVRLARSGGQYQGTTRARVLPCGTNAGAPLVPSRLRFRITVSAGRVRARGWLASAWHGTVVISTRPTVSGGLFCAGSRMTAALSAPSAAGSR